MYACNAFVKKGLIRNFHSSNKAQIFSQVTSWLKNRNPLKGKSDKSEAIKNLLVQARNGSVDAKHNLAVLSITSPEEKELHDLQNPIEVLLELVDQNHLPATIEIAKFYQYGFKSIPKNTEKAIELYEKVASLVPDQSARPAEYGYIMDAVISLRELYFTKGDIKNAYECLKRGVEAKDLTSIFILSNWLKSGMR